MTQTCPVPTLFADVIYPTRMAAARAMADAAGCSPKAAEHLLRVCNGDADAAVVRLQQAKTAREHARSTEKIARETNFGPDYLRKLAGRHGLSLEELAEQARARSRQVTVGGKTYPTRSHYFRVLSRRFGISADTIDQWFSRKKVPLEDLAAKALEAAKQRKPDRYRYQPGGAVSAYGWRWQTRASFCKYYFGHPSPMTEIQQNMDEAKTPMSWGKAALVHILRLFDIGELGADCRWSPEREATLPAYCLPLNARDAREEDELNMASFHAGIARGHAKLRALGEEARRQRS